MLRLDHLLEGSNQARLLATSKAWLPKQGKENSIFLSQVASAALCGSASPVQAGSTVEPSGSPVG